MSVSQFLGDSYCSESLYTEWFIDLFVFGLAVGFIKDWYQIGRQRFFSNASNYITLATVTLFTSYNFILWYSDKFDLKTLQKLDTPPTPGNLLLAQSFLSVGVLMAFFYNLFFIQANPRIGPLLHAFTEMLIDVAKFFFYFSFIFLAFAVSFAKLQTQYLEVKGLIQIQNHSYSSIGNVSFER